MRTLNESATPLEKKSKRSCDMVPRGLEPRTLRLLAVRSNQLSYETDASEGEKEVATGERSGRENRRRWQGDMTLCPSG